MPGRRYAPFRHALLVVRCALSRRASHEWRCEGQQISRIDCQSTKASTPVQMRSCHAAGGADEADLLAALDSVACGDLRLAHMEVARHHAISVIDVDDIAGEKKLC